MWKCRAVNKASIVCSCHYHVNEQKGATEWFNATLQHQQEHLIGSGFTEERATLTALSLLVNAVNSDIQRGEKYHNHLFETCVIHSYIHTYITSRL